MKSKFALVVGVGVLVMSLGLCACASGAKSGSASSASASASSAASSASSASASAASATASSAAASSAASSASTLTSDYWAGKLENGSTVDYFDDVQGKKPGLVILSADGAQGKAWVGELEVSDDAKTIAITDDATKEKITITPNDNPPSGTMVWEIEGYGKVSLEKASDGSLYEQHLAKVSK